MMKKNIRQLYIELNGICFGTVQVDGRHWHEIKEIQLRFCAGQPPEIVVMELQQAESIQLTVEELMVYVRDREAGINRRASAAPSPTRSSRGEPASSADSEGANG